MIVDIYLQAELKFFEEGVYFEIKKIQKGRSKVVYSKEICAHSSCKQK